MFYNVIMENTIKVVQIMLKTGFIAINSGGVQSTKNLLPVKLIAYTAFSDQRKAYQFEKYLKSGSGRAFMQKHFV